MAPRRRRGTGVLPEPELRDSEIIFHEFQQCSFNRLEEFSNSICEGDIEQTMQKVVDLLLHYRLCSPDFVARSLNLVLPEEQLRDLPSMKYPDPSKYPDLFVATHKRFSETNLIDNWKITLGTHK